MKKLFLPFLILSLVVVIIFISCKKELSCEGCRENNKPPIAIAGPDSVITLPTDSISLDDSASHDPDGIISDPIAIGWLWKKVSGPASFNLGSPTWPIVLSRPDSYRDGRVSFVPQDRIRCLY